MRFVPEYIKKPEYYETGTPDATPLQLTILGQLEIEKLRDSCKLARYILDSVSEKAKVNYIIFSKSNCNFCAISNYLVV